LMIVSALYFSFLLRFDRLAGGEKLFLLIASAAVLVKIPLLLRAGVYRRAWGLRSMRDFAAILRASLIGTFVLVSSLTFVFRFYQLSRAVFATDAVLTVVLL